MTCWWLGLGDSTRVESDRMSTSDEVLIGKAAAGDQNALAVLMWRYHGRLVGRLNRKLPANLRSLVSAEDVAQEAYFAAFQNIATFEPAGEDAFYRWLATIADNRLLDVIKAHGRQKRDRGRQVGPSLRSSVDIVNELVFHESTPSRSAARHECDRAVQVALSALTPDYRQAFQLRYIEGLPISEIARRMNRSDRAVHNLCHRSKKQVGQLLGTLSNYLTRT
jgi:RNA polymerase sigma-70 factor (ECF subfamily)